VAGPAAAAGGAGPRRRRLPAAATRLLAARLPAEACRWVEGVGHDPFAPAMVAASMAAWAELSGEKACGR
jgi:hypothetical protein